MFGGNGISDSDDSGFASSSEQTESDSTPVVNDHNAGQEGYSIKLDGEFSGTFQPN